VRECSRHATSIDWCAFRYPGGAMRVLVVEDDAMIATFVARGLLEAGLPALAATAGSAVVAAQDTNAAPVRAGR